MQADEEDNIGSLIQEVKLLKAELERLKAN